jgi:subtilisin family serine protease
MILKIADANGVVVPDAVTKAIDFAEHHVADIVNLSLEGVSPTVRDAVADRHRLLFVVAAGNGDQNHNSIDLDGTPVFPATLGRDQENVITVAASDTKLKRACFSNRGKHTVTLAAPGVGIDSTFESGDRRMSGTSQATPLVTLVASLIMSKGLREPVLIKQRIMASVDFDPTLESDVITSGRLDIRKALSVYDDIVQLSSGEIVVGSIIPGIIIEIGDREFTVPQVAKIVRYSDAPGHRHRVIQMAKGRQTYAEGDIVTPAITIAVEQPDHSVTKRTIPFDQIVDLIPASLPRPR